MNNKFVIGLTGGIGSGKSTVAKYFGQINNIPIYNSDTRAKWLMNNSHQIKEEIIKLLGDDSYQNGLINREFIANKVFINKDLLNIMNEIIHPLVKEDFTIWCKNQTEKIVLKESALLIETGSYKECDILIVVIAKKEKRIERTMQRDQLSRSEVLGRINNQTTDSVRKKLANYIIDNNKDINNLKNQIINISNNILKKLN